jgi:DNA polymerase-1
MSKQTLIIDSHYLCYRGMFTVGDLSNEEQGTGVVFSFLNQLSQLAVRFDYPKFLFAWDSERSYRRDVYPDYKRKDRSPDPKMEKLLGMCKPQFHIIRTSVLPLLGFRNIFLQTGLEADDIIAKIVMSYKGEFIIVSSDNDLYQLLNKRVRMYDIRNKQNYTDENFINEWGVVSPEVWATVKSIAGCDGDKVPGLPGIGYATAVKYLKGQLTGNKKDLIETNGKYIKFTASLVVLPHPKTQPVKIGEDKPDFKAFETLCLEYGFRSFLKKGTYEKWKRILS